MNAIRHSSATVSEGPRDPEADPDWDPCTGSGPLAHAAGISGGKP